MSTHRMPLGMAFCACITRARKSRHHICKRSSTGQRHRQPCRLNGALLLFARVPALFLLLVRGLLLLQGRLARFNRRPIP
ncbi:MAG: hypothetical protein OXC62_05040 [Aestuariivita sp.]|nr:hypothetical protein [Aestuariivita sp.]